MQGRSVSPGTCAARALLGAGAVLGAAVTCAAQSSAGGPAITLTDAAGSTGLIAAHVAGPLQMFATMSAGGGVGDFDRDGDQDVFVLGGMGGVDRYFVNQGDGTFVERSEESGLAHSHAGFGVAIGDYDNDGFLDIFITSGGPAESIVDADAGNHLLYRNLGGAGFEQVAFEAGVAYTVPEGYDGWSPAFGDYDLDGDLDLAVAGWFGGIRGNRLFENLGDGTFEAVTAAALRTGAGTPFSLVDTRGFSPIFVDFTGDRFPELLWVSDFLTSRYFINERDGSFVESTQDAGVGLEANGMGVTVGDFDNDGHCDFYVTSIFTDQPTTTVPGTGNMLYINDGDGTSFSEISAQAGVKDGGWGWGTVAVDLDHDGWLDIFETNGWPFQWLEPEDFRTERSYVFRNRGNLTFEEVGVSAGCVHRDQGRGALRVDLDDDGDQDLLTFCSDGHLRVYRNDLTGPGTNWLRVVLDNSGQPGVAPDGYGAKVVIEVGDSEQHRWVGEGTHFLAQSELSAHFGVSDASVIDRVRVEWPNGAVTRMSSVDASRTLHIAYRRTDWNANGRLNGQDFFDFINDFFGSGADYDLDGNHLDADFFAFVTDFFGAP